MRDLVGVDAQAQRALVPGDRAVQVGHREVHRPEPQRVRQRRRGRRLRGLDQAHGTSLGAARRLAAWAPCADAWTSCDGRRQEVHACAQRVPCRTPPAGSMLGAVLRHPLPERHHHGHHDHRHRQHGSWHRHPRAGRRQHRHAAGHRGGQGPGARRRALRRRAHRHRRRPDLRRRRRARRLVPGARRHPRPLRRPARRQDGHRHHQPGRPADLRAADRRGRLGRAGDRRTRRRARRSSRRSTPRSPARSSRARSPASRSTSSSPPTTRTPRPRSASSPRAPACASSTPGRSPIARQLEGAGYLHMAIQPGLGGTYASALKIVSWDRAGRCAPRSLSAPGRARASARGTPTAPRRTAA